MLALTSAQEFSIRELAASFGVSHRTLRYYEQRGFLKPRRVGSKRHYSIYDYRKLEIILKAKRQRFTLQDIEDMINSCGKQIATQLPLSPEQILAQIERLTREREAVEQAIVELQSML